MVNLGVKPKSLFKRSDLDFYTVWLYMQKAEDSDLKAEILERLSGLLLELGESPTASMQNPVANSAANIMMAQ